MKFKKRKINFSYKKKQKKISITLSMCHRVVVKVEWVHAAVEAGGPIGVEYIAPSGGRRVVTEDGNQQVGSIKTNILFETLAISI